MNKIYKVLFSKINRSKYIRRFSLLLCDFFLLLISTLLSFKLTLGSFELEVSGNKQDLLKYFIPFIGVIIYFITGQYKSLTRYLLSSFYYIQLCRNLIFVLVALIISYQSNHFFSASFWALLFFISLFLTSGIRIGIRDLIPLIGKKDNLELKEVIIYGAGSAGSQLASMIASSKNYKIKFFIDDDQTLWGRNISNIKIYPPKYLYELSKKKNVYQVLLAIPSLSPKQRKIIFDGIKDKGFKVLSVPSINELTQENYRLDTLRPIKIEDLLSRDSVHFKSELLNAGIRNKSICVTGAGGSIGSEICRQIIFYSPKKLLLIENSEHSLYQIQQELIEKIKPDIEIIAVLGNVLNEKLLNHTFEKHKIDRIYHAAAYKHVPIVEQNALESINNNIFSTKNICDAALKNSIEEIILLSSDKAVRPTSIMGATKRVSELIFKAYSSKNLINDKNEKYKFSMVRFGNVLGSSGSVVPLFKKQIANGGPLTITHSEVTRYFMTIPEAAQLVLLTTELSEGGDLFLLDMGEPVKILELAKQMIILSGNTVKNKENPNGDIEVITTGLRPGEKLYEELLIDGKSEKTIHPLIYRANEKYVEPDKLKEKLEFLDKSIKLNDLRTSLKLLKELVPEWKNSN